METDKSDGETVTSSPKTILNRALRLTVHYLDDVQKRVTSHQAGQLLFQKTEDAIRAIEKCIEWAEPPKPQKVSKPKSTPDPSSVPDADQTSLNGSNQRAQSPASTRPLPWIVFIPLLAAWRGTRLVCEAASSLLGKEPIKPEQVVLFLRNRRRDLRAARIRGKRSMSLSTTEQPSGFFSAVLSYVIPVPTRRATIKRKENKQDVGADMQSPTSDDQETVFGELNSVGDEDYDSDEDPDFEPNSSLESDDDTSSSGTDVVDTDQPTPKAGVFRTSRTPSFIADDIIHEENEDSVDENIAPLLDRPKNGHPRGSTYSTENDDTISDKYSESLSLSMSSKSSDAISAK